MPAPRRTRASVDYTHAGTGTPPAWMKAGGSKGRTRQEADSDEENEDPAAALAGSAGGRSNNRVNKPAARSKGRKSTASDKRAGSAHEHAPAEQQAERKQQAVQSSPDAHSAPLQPSQRSNKRKASASKAGQVNGAEEETHEQQYAGKQGPNAKKARAEQKHDKEQGSRAPHVMSLKALGEKQAREADMEKEVKEQKARNRPRKSSVAKDAAASAAASLEDHKQPSEAGTGQSNRDSENAAAAGLPGPSIPQGVPVPAPGSTGQQQTLNKGVAAVPAAPAAAPADPSTHPHPPAVAGAAGTSTMETAAGKQVLRSGQKLNLEEQALLQTFQPATAGWANETQAFLMLQHQYQHLQDLYRQLKGQKIAQLEGLLEEQDTYVQSQQEAMNQQMALLQAKAEEAERKAAATDKVQQELAAAQEEVLQLKRASTTSREKEANLQAELGRLQQQNTALQQQSIALKEQLAATEAASLQREDQLLEALLMQAAAATALPGAVGTAHNVSVAQVDVVGGEEGRGVGVVYDAEGMDMEPAGRGSGTATRSVTAGALQVPASCTPAAQAMSVAGRGRQLLSVGMQYPTPAVPSPGIACQFPTPAAATDAAATSDEMPIEDNMRSAGIACQFPTPAPVALAAGKNAHVVQQQTQAAVVPADLHCQLGNVNSTGTHMAHADMAVQAAVNTNRELFCTPYHHNAPHSLAAAATGASDSVNGRMPTPDQPQQRPGGSMCTELVAAGMLLDQHAVVAEGDSCNVDTGSVTGHQVPGDSMMATPNEGSAPSVGAVSSAPEMAAPMHQQLAAVTLAQPSGFGSTKPRLPQHAQVQVLVDKAADKHDSPVEGLRTTAGMGAEPPAQTQPVQSKPAAAAPPPHIRCKPPAPPAPAVTVPPEPIIDLDPRSAQKQRPAPAHQDAVTPIGAVKAADAMGEGIKIATASTPSLVLGDDCPPAGDTPEGALPRGTVLLPSPPAPPLPSSRMVAAAAGPAPLPAPTFAPPPPVQLAADVAAPADGSESVRGPLQLPGKAPQMPGTSAAAVDSIAAVPNRHSGSASCQGSTSADVGTTMPAPTGPAVTGTGVLPQAAVLRSGPGSTEDNETSADGLQAMITAGNMDALPPKSPGKTLRSPGRGVHAGTPARVREKLEGFKRLLGLDISEDPISGLHTYTHAGTGMCFTLHHVLIGIAEVSAHVLPADDADLAQLYPPGTEVMEYVPLDLGSAHLPDWLQEPLQCEMKDVPSLVGTIIRTLGSGSRV